MPSEKKEFFPANKTIATIAKVFLFVLVIVFSLNGKYAFAETGKCNGTVDDSGGNPTEDSLIDKKINNVTVSSKEECDSKCADAKEKLSDYEKKYWTCGYTSDSDQQKKDEKQVKALTDYQNQKGVCDGFSSEASSNGGFIIGTLIAVFKCLLLWILRFTGLLLNLAVIIFRWTIDADALNEVLKGTNSNGSDVVYTIWKMVRDMLNIAFILTLLFSAFATVFQIERYNYKRILLNLVIMALLVNFSYPITLFIIDVSNVIMYFFINTLLGNGSGGISNILQDSGLGNIIKDTSMSSDALYIIAAIVFVFIFAFTVLIIGLLLLIRVIALAILLMFSSLAYIGSILPGSKLAAAASGWWKNLMEYAFFGPIMLFMVYVAAKFMAAAKDSQLARFKTIASGSGDVTFTKLVAEASFFAIPLVILWMGIMSAKKSSVVGAGIVVGAGMKWSGKVAKMPLVKSGISGATSQAAKNFQKRGFLGSDAVERRQTKILSRTPEWIGGDKTATRDYNRKKVQEKRKEWKDNGGASDEDIQKALKGSNIERMAAALEAAEKNGFKDIKDKNGNVANSAFNQYKEALDAVKDDPAYKKLFDDKIGDKNIRFKVLYDIEKGKNDENGNPMNNAQIYASHLDGLNSDALAGQKGLHDDIANNADFRNYAKDRFTLKDASGNSVLNAQGQTQLDSKKLTELFKKLKGKEQNAYRGVGLDPNVKPSGPSNNFTMP